MFKRFAIIALILPFFLSGCISGTQLGLSPSIWQQKTPQQQSDMRQAYKDIRHYQQQQIHLRPMDSGLSVSISSGRAMMPPFKQAYAFLPATAWVPAGGCALIPLIARDASSTVKLTACYIDQRLALDPSRFRVKDWRGTLFFYDNPVWAQGFTYKGVSSQGYVRLVQANIFIKRLKG